MRKYDETVAPSSQASVSGDALERISLLLIFAASVLLVGGMIADGNKVTLSIICGIAFFSLFGGFVIAVLSGQLGAVIINRQKEITIRERDRAQERIWMVQATPLPVVREAPPPSLPPPHLKELGNFIAAVPEVGEEIKISSYDFILSLFIDGLPHPRRILDKDSKRPGQINKSKPRKEVVEYLKALNMVKENEEDHMLFFNTEAFPTMQSANMAIKSGIPAGRF